MSRKSIDSAPRSAISSASAVTFASSTPSDSTMSLPTLTRISGRVQIFVVSGSMRFPASSADTAVDGDDLARDVARLLGGEEHRQRRDLFGSSHAPHRSPLADLGRGHADERTAHVGLDQSRRDRVHGDAPRAELPRQRDREGVHAALRRGVAHLAAARARRQHRAHVDDASPAQAEHVPGGQTRAAKDAVEIGLEQRRPLVVGGLDEEPLAADPRVVDQDIEAARARDDGADQRLGVGAVAHVGLVHEAVTARRLDRVQRLLGALVLLAIVDAHRGARASQADRDRPADAPRGAGHERDSSRQRDLHAPQLRIISAEHSPKSPSVSTRADRNPGVVDGARAETPGGSVACRSADAQARSSTGLAAAPRSAWADFSRSRGADGAAAPSVRASATSSAWSWAGIPSPCRLTRSGAVFASSSTVSITRVRRLDSRSGSPPPPSRPSPAAEAKPTSSPCTRAPRASACSASSRTRRPLPSPGTRPGRPSSAAITPPAQCVAKNSSSSWSSAPPQRATSRSPSSMSRAASPTARAPPTWPSVTARQNP